MSLKIKKGNKMSKKENTVDLGPLYKRMHGYDVKPWTYKCTVSGAVCERVTKYFQDYVAFVKRMSDTNDKGSFLIHEPNLCISCWVYENELKYKSEIAKLNKQIQDLQQQICR